LQSPETIFVRALIISADGFEDSELLVPMYRLEEAGVAVDVASMRKGRIHGQHGYEVEANKALVEVDAQQYDLLMLPGGRAPEVIRRDKAALEIVQSFFRRNRPVAAICHGPQILASAGVLRGRRATCFRLVADTLRRAGALYEDSEVVADGNLVTSRRPADLPAFLREMMKLVGAAVEAPAAERSSAGE
jgi:protease I